MQMKMKYEKEKEENPKQLFSYDKKTRLGDPR